MNLFDLLTVYLEKLMRCEVMGLESGYVNFSLLFRVTPFRELRFTSFSRNSVSRNPVSLLFRVTPFRR